MISKLEINESEYVAHLKEISQADGLCGVYVNAWVGEIYSLTPGERQRLIKIARGTLPRSIPVISGIIGFNLQDMVKAGLEAKEAGADVLEVFPPFDSTLFFRRLMSFDEVPLQFFSDMAREGEDAPLHLQVRVGARTIVFKRRPVKGGGGDRGGGGDEGFLPDLRRLLPGVEQAEWQAFAVRDGRRHGGHARHDDDWGRWRTGRHHGPGPRELDAVHRTVPRRQIHRSASEQADHAFALLRPIRSETLRDHRQDHNTLRVLLLEPLLDQSLVAFLRAVQRLLASDPELRQQATDGIGAQRHAKLVLDQLGDHVTRPQRKREPSCKGFFCVTVL